MKATPRTIDRRGISPVGACAGCLRAWFESGVIGDPRRECACRPFDASNEAIVWPIRLLLLDRQPIYIVLYGSSQIGWISPEFLERADARARRDEDAEWGYDL